MRDSSYQALAAISAQRIAYDETVRARQELQGGLGQAAARQDYATRHEQVPFTSTPKKKGKMPLRTKLQNETDEWLKDVRREK